MVDDKYVDHYLYEIFKLLNIGMERDLLMVNATIARQVCSPEDYKDFQSLQMEILSCGNDKKTKQRIYRSRGLKKCSGKDGCGGLFPATLKYFGPKPKNSDGIDTVCHPCNWEKASKHQQENPKAAAAATRRWNEKYPEQRAALSRAGTKRYRARKAGAPGQYPELWFKAIYTAYGCRCVCCKRKVRYKDITEDHVVALNNGGSNFIWNIQPLCRSCNSTKGDRHNTDYRPFVPEWVRKLKKGHKRSNQE